MTDFWAKVLIRDPSVCWFWTGPRIKSGYGLINGNPAHRVAWQITYGDIPAGLQVCHACDNPTCVNPSHLLLGSQLANIIDARGKDRMNRKLSEDAVRQIFIDYQQGSRIKDLASREKVSVQTIRDILSGQTWQTLGLDPLLKPMGKPRGKNLPEVTVVKLRDLHAQDPNRYSAYRLSKTHRLNITTVMDILRGKTYPKFTLGQSVYQSNRRGS